MGHSIVLLFCKKKIAVQRPQCQTAMLTDQNTAQPSSEKLLLTVDRNDRDPQGDSVQRETLWSTQVVYSSFIYHIPTTVSPPFPPLVPSSSFSLSPSPCLSSEKNRPPRYINQTWHSKPQ